MVYADGSLQTLDFFTDPEVLQAALTIDGSESQ